LKKKVERRKQHIWTNAGTLSSGVQVFYVETLGYEVLSDLKEDILTPKEIREINKLKKELQSRIVADAMREFNPGSY